MAKWQEAPAVQQQSGRWQSAPTVEQPSGPGYVERVAGTLSDYVRAAARKPWQIPQGIMESGISAATGMIAGPVNDFFNAAMEAGEFPTKDVIPTYQPRTELGQAAVRAGAEIMSPVAAAVDYGTDINNPDPAVRATGRLIRGGSALLPFVGVRSLPKTAPKTPTPRPTPKTAAELRAEANAAYARADELGRGELVRQESLGNFAGKTERMLADEAFDPDLEPMTAYSLNKLMEEATRPGVAGHTPQGLEVLRRKLLKAEGNAVRAGNAGDARQVARIIDDFDDYADNLVQGRDVIGAGGTAESIAARTQARQLWARMKKTQTIEDLIERAQNSSPALTQTGLENALRIEFKNLANNQRRMRQFTAEEKAAIQQVARGSRTQQVLRRVSSLAPRGVVSGAGTTLLGNAIGGPAGSVGLMALGEAGALASRLMRIGDVEAARTLISTGQRAAPQAPAISGPVAGAVRASTVVPPALAAEEIDRQQRNFLQRRSGNALARR